MISLKGSQNYKSQKAENYTLVCYNDVRIFATYIGHFFVR